MAKRLKILPDLNVVPSEYFDKYLKPITNHVKEMEQLPADLQMRLYNFGVQQFLEKLTGVVTKEPSPIALLGITDMKTAKPVVEYLSRFPETIRWHPETGVISLRGVPQPDSHIADLVRFLTVQNKAYKPFPVYASILRDINFPLSLVKNSRARTGLEEKRASFRFL